MLITQVNMPRPDIDEPTDATRCPDCNTAMFRVWRRPVDRLSAWLVPTRRYRCQSFQCQWEGNVRLMPMGVPSAPGGRPEVHQGGEQTSVSRVFLLSMAVALASGIFILVSSYTDWLEPGGFLVSAAIQPPHFSSPT